ncbi:MAG: hypothetical protein ABIH56_06580 [Candidatus Margulisiibacteriota bacterium]
MNAWGVNGERSGVGLNAWRQVGAQNGDVVAEIVKFVDNSDGENTGYKIRIGNNAFTDTIDHRYASTSDRRDVNTALNGIESLDRPKIVAFLPKLTTSLALTSSQRWNLDTVRTLLRTKGISLEELNSKLSGVSLDGLTDDQIIEIALKAAGCTTEEIYGAQSQTVKDSHTAAMTELESEATAYKALLEKANPPATQSELDAAKTAYEAALTAFQTATKTGPTFNADQLPEALKTRYNTATAGIETATTARTSRLREAETARTATIQQENNTAKLHIEQLKTTIFIASSITPQQLQAISYNLPANHAVLTIRDNENKEYLVLAERQTNGQWKIVTSGLPNCSVITNAQGQPIEIIQESGSFFVRNAHFPVNHVTQQTRRPAPGQTPGTSTTPRPTPRPTGLNANGQRIWQQLSDREIAVSQANVRRINDGTISKDDAVALGLVSQADQAGVFTAYNKTDTDQVWDTNELGRYLDVVKTVSERSGRPIGEVLETFRNTRYLVTVNFDQIGTTLSGIGTAGWTGVVLGNPSTPEERLAAANTVAGNLSTKVETKVLEEIKKRVAAGTIANQSQLEQYLFNAMMGSMTGDFAGWGVPELQGKVSAFKPRSAEQTGEDLTTWVKTGKSPDASATGSGTETEQTQRDLSALETAADPIAFYNSHGNIKTNPRAIRFICQKLLEDGKYNDLMTFVGGLPKEVRAQFYEEIIKSLQTKISSNLTSSNRSEANRYIDILKTVKTKINEIEAAKPSDDEKVDLASLNNRYYVAIYQVAVKLAETDKPAAYDLLNQIPDDTTTRFTVQTGSGENAREQEVNGRFEAKLNVAIAANDFDTINSMISAAPANSFKQALAYQALGRYYYQQAERGENWLENRSKAFDAFFEARKIARGLTGNDQSKGEALARSTNQTMDQLLQQTWGGESAQHPKPSQIDDNARVNNKPWRTLRTEMYRKFRSGTTTPSTGGGGGGGTPRYR